METPPNARNSVNAAFDSVNLIDNTLSSTGMTVENKIKIIQPNVSHLKIMMNKNWFISVLINDEGNQIQTCIINGENFLSTNG